MFLLELQTTLNRLGRRVPFNLRCSTSVAWRKYYTVLTNNDFTLCRGSMPQLQAQSSVWNRLIFLNNYLMWDDVRRRAQFPKVIESSFWCKFISVLPNVHVHMKLGNNASEEIMRTLTCKHKTWGGNWLYLRSYLKAFSVFNVLETCRVYLLAIDLGIVKFIKKFIERFFEKCGNCRHGPNYVQKL